MISAAHVADQYATADRLTTRATVWRPGADGRDPVAALATRILAAASGGRVVRVLEIGCGTAALARRVCRAAAESGTDLAYLATDRSAGMIRAARTSPSTPTSTPSSTPTGRTTGPGVVPHGFATAIVDATALPFATGAFDVVVAAWMLYHVPDLDRTLRDCRRVLAPGGTLLAATNGDRHTAGLRALAGLAPLRTRFSRENGAVALSRHFESVTREDFATVAVCDYEAALAYLGSLGEELPRVPDRWTGTRDFVGAASVFEAR